MLSGDFPEAGTTEGCTGFGRDKTDEPSRRGAAPRGMVKRHGEAAW